MAGVSLSATDKAPKARKAQKAEKRTEKTAVTRARNVCTDAEMWEFSAELQHAVPEAIREDFLASLGSKRPAASGFSEGMHLAASTDPATAVFGEYWLGRSFHLAKQHELAIPRLNKVLERKPTASSVPIQIAAMACLHAIYETYPEPVLLDRAAENLPHFFAPGLVPQDLKPVLWETGIHLVMRGLKELRAKAYEQAVQLLKGSGAYEDYARALVAIHTGQAYDAVSPLAKIAAATELPPSIKAHQNEMRLILARLYYEDKRIDEAVKMLDLIDKRSNVVVQALSTQAWVDLARQNYTKVVGTSISLQSGGLRSTFSPEAFMVTAMALNELCLFPESLHMLRTFRKNYERSYLWLKERTGKTPGKQNERLYPLTLAYLKGEKPGVPDRILSEWIRTPSFVALQQNINGSFRQEKSVPGAIKEAEAFLASEAVKLKQIRMEFAVAKATEDAKADAKQAAEAQLNAKKSAAVELVAQKATAKAQASVKKAEEASKAAAKKAAAAVTTSAAKKAAADASAKKALEAETLAKAAAQEETTTARASEVEKESAKQASAAAKESAALAAAAARESAKRLAEARAIDKKIAAADAAAKNAEGLAKSSALKARDAETAAKKAVEAEVTAKQAVVDTQAKATAAVATAKESATKVSQAKEEVKAAGKAVVEGDKAVASAQTVFNKAKELRTNPKKAIESARKKEKAASAALAAAQKKAETPEAVAAAAKEKFDGFAKALSEAEEAVKRASETSKEASKKVATVKATLKRAEERRNPMIDKEPILSVADAEQAMKQATAQQATATSELTAAKAKAQEAAAAAKGPGKAAKIAEAAAAKVRTIVKTRTEAAEKAAADTKQRMEDAQAAGAKFAQAGTDLNEAKRSSVETKRAQSTAQVALRTAITDEARAVKAVASAEATAKQAVTSAKASTKQVADAQAKVRTTAAAAQSSAKQAVETRASATVEAAKAKQFAPVLTEARAAASTAAVAQATAAKAAAAAEVKALKASTVAQAAAKKSKEMAKASEKRAEESAAAAGLVAKAEEASKKAAEVAQENVKRVGEATAAAKAAVETQAVAKATAEKDKEIAVTAAAEAKKSASRLAQLTEDGKKGGDVAALGAKQEAMAIAIQKAFTPQDLEKSAPKVAKLWADLEMGEARHARLAKALPKWTETLNQLLAAAPKQREALMARIEKGLRDVNARMLRQIGSVIENNELIEAEIWNGASQDIVWQNANPDFKKALKSGKIANDRKPAGATKDVYNWGTSTGGVEGGQEEIWEDEVGAVSANLEDNCTNKEKYMKLQRR